MAESFEEFCERCGTRHVQHVEPSPQPLGGRLLRGLRRTDESDVAVAESPLRLCLSCRGYNCTACWNERAGFCQDCAPMAAVAEVELEQPIATADVLEWPTADVAAAEPDLPPTPPPAQPPADDQPSPSSQPLIIAATPVDPVQSIAPAEATTPAPAAELTPEFSAILDLPAVSDLLLEMQPPAPSEAEPPARTRPVFGAEPVVPDTPTAKARPVFGGEPETELEPAVEPVAEPAAEVVVEPVVEVEPVAEPVAEVVVEPVVEVEPVAEPAAEVVVAPVVEVEPVAELPKLPVLPAPPAHVPPAPLAGQLPPGARLPSLAAIARTTARRMLTGAEATPAEPEQPQVRDCVSCQLSISARAHFCRRCGTRQD